MNTGDTRRFEQAQLDIALADVVFLSIQKSGRTWVRFFLQEYFGRLAGVTLQLAPRIMAGTDVSPSVSFHADFFEAFEHEAAPVRMLFPNELASKPLIFLVRDARDVVVSAYHYIRSRRPLEFARNLPSSELSDYVHSDIYGVERLAEYQLRATEFFLAHRAPKLYLTYELLRADPEKEFSRLVLFLSQGPLDEAAFQAAIEASSLNAMQTFEIEVSREGRAGELMRLGIDNWSGDTNQLKVRRGVVGGFRDEFPGLDRLEQYPLTQATLTIDLDPVAYSDTHWMVGSKIGGAAVHAPLVAKQRQLESQIAELEAKNNQLRATLRGRDTIITKLKSQLLKQP